MKDLSVPHLSVPHLSVPHLSVPQMKESCPSYARDMSLT